jgi:N-acetylmuramoyl-L-alanine amidase
MNLIEKLFNKKSIYLLITFIANFNVCFSYTILLDPGHGGDDLGAHFNHTESDILFEKEITLKLAHKIYDELKNEYKVYFTRNTDQYVSLEDRSKMAEVVNADLFISIHVNSSANKDANGIETYYLDNHNDMAIRKIEKVENSKLVRHENDLVVQKILIDLIISKIMPSSRQLAGFIHESVKERINIEFKITDRKVRAGLFYVLALSKRPGVLLEAGFLSNTKDSKKLTDLKYQKEYAKGVKEGIDKYFNQRNKDPFYMSQN